TAFAALGGRAQCPSGGRVGTNGAPLMTDAIAVLNAGSSSFKFSLFSKNADGLALVARGQAEGLYTSPRFVAKDHSGAVINEKAWGDGISLGHGGALDHLVAFVRERLADHRLVGVGRDGFHGLSYEYITSVLADYDARASAGKVVVLHLGNGSSMCAIANGRSMASTMGFTAADGLPMGTRCGNLDPGVVLYMMDELKMDVRAIEKVIYQQSGLLGVSGISSDMRTLLASGEPGAKFAVDMFVYRIGRELGSLAGALGGLDAIVFTGGIGEHATAIRERVCQGA